MKTSTKFQIGDMVQYYGHGVSNENERKRYEQGLVPPQNSERQFKVGAHYKVVAIHDAEYGFFMDVQGEGSLGDRIVVQGCSSSNFIKINSPTMKITNLVKKILDKDTRTLVEAGFINGDLQLTDDGVSELLGILFLANKEELVTIANEKITDLKR